MDNFPDDIIHIIFSKCEEFKDIYNLGLITKKINRIYDSKQLWIYLMMSKFPQYLRKRNYNWKMIYKELLNLEHSVSPKIINNFNNIEYIEYLLDENLVDNIDLINLINIFNKNPHINQNIFIKLLKNSTFYDLSSILTMVLDKINKGILCGIYALNLIEAIIHHKNFKKRDDDDETDYFILYSKLTNINLYTYKLLEPYFNYNSTNIFMHYSNSQNKELEDYLLNKLKYMNCDDIKEDIEWYLMPHPSNPKELLKVYGDKFKRLLELYKDKFT